METEEVKAGQALEKVANDIQQWRQTRSKLGEMPANLWEDAAAVARVLGVHSVSKALHVNYRALQQRARPSPRGNTPPRRRAGRPPNTGGGDFIEMRQVALPSNPAMEGTVEEVAPDGARLTLRLKGSRPGDIVALVAAFREGRV